MSLGVRGYSSVARLLLRSCAPRANDAACCLRGRTGALRRTTAKPTQFDHREAAGGFGPLIVEPEMETEMLTAVIIPSILVRQGEKANAPIVHAMLAVINVCSNNGSGGARPSGKHPDAGRTPLSGSQWPKPGAIRSPAGPQLAQRYFKSI